MVVSRMSELYAELHETHTGIVLLVGDRALKAKKPCRMPFLDFSSVELREQACARELDLNRRLAADVYLGLGHLSDPLGGPSEPIVVMRRMSEKTRLSTMIACGEDVEPALTDLSARIAAFHATAVRSSEIDRQGTVPFVQRRWEANLLEIAALADVPARHLLPTIERLATAYLAGRESLFAARIAESRVVDGHGDLICEDVFCLPDGPRALDCLDFDDALRFVDGIDDVCFLAMDLEFRGRPDLATAFLSAYLAAAGDAVPPSLIGHYVAYRALVRAKVECIRGAQGDIRSIEAAEAHLELAVAHLKRSCVRLCLVGGLPGTGKSTVSTALARRVGATVISSDKVRKELVAAGVIDGEPGTFEQGLYSPEAVALVYKSILARAREKLENGVSVIIDASWTDPERVAEAAALALATDAVHIVMHCTVPVRIAAARISQRRGGDSDATVAVASAMAERASTDLHGLLTVDTSGSIEASVDTAAGGWNSI